MLVKSSGFFPAYISILQTEYIFFIMGNCNIYFDFVFRRQVVKKLEFLGTELRFLSQQNG